MAERKKRVGGTYLLRDAPSDIVSGRPPRPSSDAPAAKGTYPEKLPSPPAVPTLRPPTSSSAPPPPMSEPRSRARRSSAPPSDRPRRSGDGRSTIRPRRATPAGRVEHVGTVKMDALDAKSVSSVPPAPEDALLTALRQLARSAPGDEAPAIRSVLRHDTAIGQLVRHFPGPVWFDRRQPHQRLPRGRHVSAFASALIEAGERAAPHLSGLLVHTHADIRFYAALTVQDAPHDDHVRPLARLVLDRDRGVRRAALQALAAHARLPSYERVLGQLRSTAVEVETPQSWRVRAMEALATLGDVRALDELIECLGDRDRAIGRAAHAALRELTRHDLGTMRRTWRRWAKAHGRRPRVSWLIDALADRRDDLRAAAFRELAELSGETFGCTPDADRKAHAEAQDAFARWWQTRGAR